MYNLKMSPWRTLIFNVQPTFVQHKKERQCGGNVVLTLGHNLTYIQRSTNVGKTSCVSWVNTVYDGPNHFRKNSSIYVITRTAVFFSVTKAKSQEPKNER